MTAYTRQTTFARRTAAAAASSGAVAVAALAASILLFFGAAGLNPAALATLFQYFVYSTIITFVLLAIFALVGIYRYWYLAVVGALIASVIGSLLGFTITVATSGTAVTGDVFAQVPATLAGPNLGFVIFTVIGAVTLGSVIWKRMVGDRPASTSDRRIAVVRAPAENLADGQVTHVKRKKVDSELADAQWDSYVAAMADNGWDIVEVPTAPALADSVFVEDAMVLFGDTAVMASPGAESRRGETDAVRVIAGDLGLSVEQITLPGTLDGGDVLKVGTTVYVGRGGRTNAEGIRQLRAIVARLGFTVVAVPVTKVLHLKSAVTALPDGTVIGYPPLVDDPSIFDRFLAVPEEAGSHVVVLAPDTVLMATSAPKSITMIEDLGYRVVGVDISEFEKLEGCVTCLSVRVR
ncbi:MAG: dimethylarginine dimethylaminohydrolase [Microbacteriaceae bacterium]|nr:dimethylarginine dimethylaminohydrolase [Microbacteriaceae bacterium]